MQIHIFLTIMEQEACRRFMKAHQACVAKATSVFVPGTVQYPPASHWTELERLQARADREKKRHEKWLNFRLANSGLPPISRH